VQIKIKIGILSILAVLLVLIIIGLKTNNIYSNVIISGPTNNQNSFKWGVGINPYPLEEKSQDVLNGVIKDAKDLGVGWVRLNWPSYIRVGDWKFVDNIVNSISAKGLKILMIYEPDENRLTAENNNYDYGYQDGVLLAKHYKEKIAYYQMANEPANFCIKKDWPGVSEDSYETDKCSIYFNWLKGFSDGLTASDKNAKKIISGHWLHVGFMKLAILGGVSFDIIGWDWNGWGTDLTKIKFNNEDYDLVKQLKSFNKELWITESTSENGSLDSEEAQAMFFRDFLPNVYNTKAFSAIFALRLHDEVSKQNSNNAGWGLVGINKNSEGVWEFANKKQAYFEYKKIIKEFGD